MSALVPDASLRVAFMFWDAVDATPQDAICALERSSGDSLNLLSCRRRGWNLELFELVSVWLPNIYVLSITNLLVVDTRPSEVSFILDNGLYMGRMFLNVAFYSSSRRT